MAEQSTPIYSRILVKLSGEALMTGGGLPFDLSVIDSLVSSLADVRAMGVQIAVVVGAGNLFRGKGLSAVGLEHVTADQMGMLATVMNGLALRDAFDRAKVPCRLLSAFAVDGLVDPFCRHKALHHLELDRILILAGGTGNPLVTTDSAASLRAIEINADAMFKATTQVDGVYSSDPREDSSAVMYPKLSFQEALDKELAVMDLTSFCQCRDHNMLIHVFNITKADALRRVVLGEAEGTVISK